MTKSEARASDDFDVVFRTVAAVMSNKPVIEGATGALLYRLDEARETAQFMDLGPFANVLLMMEDSLHLPVTKAIQKVSKHNDGIVTVNRASIREFKSAEEAHAAKEAGEMPTLDTLVIIACDGKTRAWAYMPIEMKDGKPHIKAEMHRAMLGGVGGGIADPVMMDAEIEARINAPIPSSVN